MKRDLELLIKAYRMEHEKSARLGIPRGGWVHSACVFYYYSKLTGAKPEDWKEFCLWLNTLHDKFNLQPPFLHVNFKNAVEEALAMHRINMRFGIEKPSAKGFWSMCRKIAEIYDYKQGKARFPWSGGALIILREDLQKRGF
jgi:hypothetical protein